jgi:Holliday junction resolvasome RuvABC endonuclease subunit
VRFIGLDPSLSCTGAVVIGRPGAGHDLEVDHVLSIKTSGSKRATIDQRAARLAAISRQWDRLLDTVAEEHPGDGMWLAVEAHDFQTKKEEGGHAHDRAGLWWMLVTAAGAYGARVAIVPPPTLKVYATGDGKASKEQVQESVERRYGISLANDNEADALTLAAMAADAYGTPLAEAPRECRRALTSVTWPTMIG